MFVSTLLCFLRDCMKGDETENKKIGCTVNLMVKMFPSSLCDTVQSHWNWDGKGWDRNLYQASVASESKHWDDRRKWWGLWGSSGGLWSDSLLSAGPDGSGSSGLCPAEFCVSLWHRFYNSSHLFFQLLTTFILKKISCQSCHSKISGLDQCECEKNYYSFFSTKNVFSFNNFTSTDAAECLNGESQELRLCFFFHRISTNLKLTRRRCTSAISTSFVTCTCRLRTTQVRETLYSLLELLMTFLTLPMLYNILLNLLERICMNQLWQVGRQEAEAQLLSSS